jgi:hypothetical protein
VRTRALALVGAGLLLAACGGGGGKTAAPATTAETTTATATTAATSTGAATPRTKLIAIRIVGGKPAGGITRETVDKGQLVDLVVHSDVADEVHLHGYDLHQDVEAGGTARIRFRAKIPGVFEAELENRKLQILELTVQ